MTKKSSTKTSKDIRNVSQANPSFQLNKKMIFVPAIANALLKKP